VIRLGLREEKRFCRILFADNGIGYSDEMLRQLNGRKSRQPPPNIRGRASSAGSYRHAAGRPSSVTARRAGASARCGFGSGGRKFHTETGTIPLYNIILLIND